MKSGGGRRIGVLDLGGERIDLLRALFGPLGSVEELSERSDLTRVELDLLVIDPPDTGISAGRLATWVRASGSRPLLVLGELPPGDWPGVTAGTGALRPSRIEALVRAALEPPRSRARRGRSAHLAPLVPLAPAERLRLERLAASGDPVVLVGEPGAGKALLARHQFGREGDGFVRIELPTPGPLADDPRLAGTRGLLYLAALDDLPLPDVPTVLGLVERAMEGELRLALGAHNGERALSRLGDEARLWLGPATITVPTLRSAPAELPARFALVLETLAQSHGMTAPPLAEDAETALAAWPWPMNFEELVACARRALLASDGSALRAPDLAIPRAGRDAEPGRPGRHAANEPTPPPLLDALVRELAHEIKNPLVSVKTFTQLLPERFEDAEFRDQYHRLVLADVDRIDAVLGQLEEFARLHPPQSGPVEVGRLLARALDAQQFLLRKRGLELSARVPESWGALESDADLLGYVLDAVLGEALEAMPEGARLEISPQPARNARAAPGHRLVFRYRVAPDAPAAARSDRQHRRREVLGLRHVLAQRVAERLGGTLVIEDTLDGETRVSVTFHDLR